MKKFMKTFHFSSLINASVNAYDFWWDTFLTVVVYDNKFSMKFLRQMHKCSSKSCILIFFISIKYWSVFRKFWKFIFFNSIHNRLTINPCFVIEKTSNLRWFKWSNFPGLAELGNFNGFECVPRALLSVSQP